MLRIEDRGSALNLHPLFSILDPQSHFCNAAKGRWLTKASPFSQPPSVPRNQRRDKLAASFSGNLLVCSNMTALPSKTGRRQGHSSTRLIPRAKTRKVGQAERIGAVASRLTPPVLR